MNHNPEKPLARRNAPMRQVAERMTIQEKQKIMLAHGPTTSEK